MNAIFSEKYAMHMVVQPSRNMSQKEDKRTTGPMTSDKDLWSQSASRQRSQAYRSQILSLL